MRKTFAIVLSAFGMLMAAASPAGATATSIQVSSNLNPATYGQTVTLTAQVLNSSCYVGAIIFYDSGVPISGSLGVNRSSGIATLQTSILTVGTHTITAGYVGECSSAGSSTLYQVINTASSTVSLSSSANPSTYANSVTFTATVLPSAATGTVTFKDGTTTLGTGTLSGGTTTYSTSTLIAGSHSITATYGGNSTYTGSTSSPLTQTVNVATSSTSVTSSLNPSTHGNSVTFTATVTPSLATGSVQFYDGSTYTYIIGTGTLSGGTATMSTSLLDAGSHSIMAYYWGDSNDTAGTSSPLTQIVKAVTAVTLTSDPNTSTYASSVTFSAQVTPSLATGTVTFYNGGTSIGSGTLVGGTATFTTSTLPAGSDSITASYGGDSYDLAGASSALTQTVRQATSSTSVTSNLNPSDPGNSVTFTATVTPSLATGTVTFKDGGTSIGSGTLSSSGTATFTTSTLAAGSHSITASYGGDSNDTTSTSSTLTQTVSSKASSTSVTSSPNPSTSGGSVTFTATVTPNTATGTVTFYDANGTLQLGSGTLSGSGTATLTTTALVPGLHSITATYNGDANDTPSTSPVLVQTVNRHSMTLPSYCSPL
jgi:hypothetical protein